jgi:membrane protein implicated in regulation of membrane protease activity
LFGPAKADHAYSGGMPAALIWLIFALVLAGAEALTGDMFLLMLGGGALAASASCYLMEWPVVIRPVLRRRLTPATVAPMGIIALEGKPALVLDRVARDEGLVKLDGQAWTARPLNDGDVYEPGESVTVIHIDGATAVVFRHV